jgi:hypothetical protein
MQSPGAEWAILVGGPLSTLLALDALRAVGEADGDTLCEWVYVAAELHRPGRRAALGIGLAASAGALYAHLVKPRPWLD